MKLTTTLSVLTGILMMTACVVVEDPNTNGTPPPSSESDAGPVGWQAGYQKGLSDGRGGRSRTPDRYDYIYSEADRAAFFKGYESGYNRGIRP